jgi:phage tail-like protein
MPTIGMNAGIAVAQKALGLRMDPYTAYNFLIEIEGIIAGGFSEVSGLSIETEVETKTFGGENERTYKFIKGTKYGDLTLKHGMTCFNLLWDWYEDVINGKIKRKNGSIYLLDQRGIPMMWWNFVEAYPLKWDGPALNAGSSAVAFETLTLTHNGLSKSAIGFPS